MFRKNTAGQKLGFAAINASTGAIMTGTTGFAAYIVIDGGAQGAAGGSVTDKGNGQYSFALAQADTNGNDISILFTMTGMIAVEKTFLTTAADPTNGTTFGLSNLDAAVSSRSTYAGGAVAGVTGNVGGNVLGSVASVSASVTVGTNTDKTGYALAATGLDAISVADPGGVSSMTTLPKMLVALWRKVYKKTDLVKTGTGTATEHAYADDGSTARATQLLTDDGTTQTVGAAT